MKHLLLATLSFAVLSAGFTQCDSFHTVVVPDFDPDAPTIYNVAYQDGQYQFFTTEFRLSRPDENVMAMAAVMDAGGARHVRMRWHASASCCRDRVCEIQSEPYGGTIEDTQPGGVGAAVSDGIFVYYGVTPQYFCQSGWQPARFRFWWESHGEDFHGNVLDSASGVIAYDR